jgi:hypothetical protein
LLHALWTIRVAPATGSDSAATCLFFAQGPCGSVWLGQLGDGLVALRDPGGAVQVLADGRMGFGNETTGLGLARSTSEWALRSYPALAPGTAILLASDGVAEDLRPESLSAFIQHLIEDYGARERKRGRDALARALRQWPTPGHTDDKTLVVLWHAPQEPTGQED